MCGRRWRLQALVLAAIAAVTAPAGATWLHEIGAGGVLSDSSMDAASPTTFSARAR